jgi:hypothetical protein
LFLPIEVGAGPHTSENTSSKEDADMLVDFGYGNGWLLPF